MFEELRERAFRAPVADPGTLDLAEREQIVSLMRHGRRWQVGISVNH